MKLKRTYHFLLLLSILHTMGTSQKTGKPIDDDFDHYGYMLPIESYDALAEKGYDEAVIYKKLGNTNYLNAQYENACKWYGKLLQMKDNELNPDYMYRYAQALKSVKKYDESDLWMDKFKKLKSKDLRAVKYSKNTDYLKGINAPHENYEVQNFYEINSKDSDFAPSFFGDEIVFSTARDSKSMNNALPYLNLYMTTLADTKKSGMVKLFSESLNSKANESSTIFTKDGETVYFTRNHFRKGSFKRDKEGISRLQIYRAKYKEGEWTAIEGLPFNGTDYSTAHPTLNEDGTKLYFSSDMSGSLGASDIFVVDVLMDGSFGIPQNLGPKINTEGKETFPFIRQDTLYFASDGHPGIGGLDLFKAGLDDLEQVVNLGSSINSPEDDFSLILDETAQKGFFASNRKGGKGSDDIYRFSIKRDLPVDCYVRIKGIIIDKDTDLPLSGVMIDAYGSSGEILATSKTTKEGDFSVQIPCQENQYSLVGSKDGFENGILFLLTSPSEKLINNTRITMEESDKVAEIGTDLVKILELTPIYFDLNSSYIREDALPELDKVVDYMQRRPDIVIEVGSHTDSREEDKYNLWLSDRRAKRTVDYLLSRGIESTRITGRGYGETLLINGCKNGVPCSEKNHQLNRRSEFIVVQK